MIYLIFLSVTGLIDSAYLTWEHFNNIIPPCTVHPLIPAFLIDCGKVLTSPYSIMFGVPLAVVGLIHYGLLTLGILGAMIYKKKIFRYWIVLQAVAGVIASMYFMYIQLGVIKSLCLYCTLSALISFAIGLLVFFNFKKERLELIFSVYAFVYQNFIKWIFFLIYPETIHNIMVSYGEFLGRSPLAKFLGKFFSYQDHSLHQRIAGINFDNPIGLAAGFDYNANLTQTLYLVNFGFQSVGTITNLAYEGNPHPRLGRLIKSRSLMVNKGFKNKGAAIISKKLRDLHFTIPVGVSIGMTHSKNIKAVQEAVNDVINTFRIFEKSGVKNSYYELNISCPNLVHAKDISFYPPKNLDLLLSSVDKLKLKKPVFIKMPIEKTNAEVSLMLDVIVKHKSAKGVIFGNLLKDRKDPALITSEVKKFKVGNFSGKPCEKRSNELIALTYRRYGLNNRLTIIGCGGIFSAQDAYKKIKLGASLVQLITGMIFQGPQLISQINLELVDFLKKDGFNNISQAIGYENN